MVPIHGSRVATLRGSCAIRHGRCGRFEEMGGKTKKQKRKKEKKIGRREEEGMKIQ